MTLLEYGDYECPYCSVAEVAIREVLGEFGDDVRYVAPPAAQRRPPQPQMAAEAAEAAAAQGAFWPMHDLLISDPDDLTRTTSTATPRSSASTRSASGTRSAAAHVGRVADDVASADASGVAGTPTFFINGRRHEGAYDVDHAHERAINAARKRALVASR